MGSFSGCQVVSHWFFHGVAYFAFLVSSLSASEILVNTRDGEILVLDVDSSESLCNIKYKVAALTEGRGSQAIVNLSDDNDFREFCLKQARSQGQYLGYPRAYYSDVNHTERNDIHFILSNLSNRSLFTLPIVKADLEAAGNRIDHLHPLRFLMTVFTDEELKAHIRNIRTKVWVWNHFIGGLKDSLATEASIGNITVEHVLHFSEQLQLSPALISDVIFMQMWDELVDTLITHIPRSGNHNRYDN